MSLDESLQEDQGSYNGAISTSKSFSNGYTNLSDLYINRDSYSSRDSFNSSTYSGYYENPTSLLDNYPYPQPPSLQTVEEGTLRIKGTPPSTLKVIESFNSSFTDSDEEDDVVGAMAIPQLQRNFSSTFEASSGKIDVIGSLCLQGVMQGLVYDEKEELLASGILPESIVMTANLQKHSNEFDQISVMITKNKKPVIVPESPYDPNSRKPRAPSATAPPDINQLQPSPQPLQRPRSMGVLDVRPTSVTYIDNIVRPRPLPPLSQSLPNKERKRYKVIESLLESEAAFLTSLNIAIEIYKKPLESHNNTELTQDEIKNLFGPVVSILEHHELFFSALSEQTGDWTPDKQIGDLFLASFGKKDVTKCYRIYVNNFTKAMSILEMAIKKKPKLLDFLKRQIQRSGSALSLQAILLKPIQRFPQYILFLQDLIKYTPADHPDSIIIEMAKANIEQIAKYLNEAKKTSEQRTIMKHLISKIERLPSNLLNEHTTQLVRQDIIQWMTYKNGKWIGKERNLLLFNHVLVCCTLKKKDRNATKASVIEADQVMSGEAPRLVCKWFCNIPVLEIIQPDYSKDDIPLVISTDVEKNTELIEKFKEIQNEIKKLGHDFQLLAKISGLIGLLKNNYPVLNVSTVQTQCRLLQKRMEEGYELMRSCEPRRVDIIIRGRDDVRSRLHQVLVFDTEVAQRYWIRHAQLIKLKQNEVNKVNWITTEEEIEDDDDEADGDSDDVNKYISKDSLPLAVDFNKLMHQNLVANSVECATVVDTNFIWFATGTSETSFVSIVRCRSPHPMLTETFPVSASRILCMKTVLSKSFSNEYLVLMGTECSKLLLYDTVSLRCLQQVEMPDSVLCIESYRNRVFVGTANGHVFVYTRTKGSRWNLKKFDHQIPVSNYSIRCFCVVDDMLWMGAGSSCIILNMQTTQLEHGISVTSDKSMYVKKLEKSGSGVWVILNRGATLYLFHKDNRQIIQEIDIKGSLVNIIACANISNKFDSLSHLHITTICTIAGFLWVGCSTGATLLYRIPPGLPLLYGRPFLAGDGHKSSVRVIVGLQTKLDSTSNRFDRYLSEDKEKPNTNNASSNASLPNDTSTAEGASASSANADNNHSQSNEGTMKEFFPPRVSQVIKKLELTKQILQSKIHPVKPIPKPRTKIVKARRISDPQSLEQLVELAVPGEPVIVEPVEPVDPVTIEPVESVTIEPIEPLTIEPVEQITIEPVEPVTIEPIHLQAGQCQASDTSSPVYNNMTEIAQENNENIYDDVPYENIEYDEVPLEEEYVWLSDEDIDDQNDSFMRSRSFTDVINPSRYEKSFLQLSDDIYQPLISSNITLTIPGHQSITDHDATFVFTGGSGLTNYRPTAHNFVPPQSHTEADSHPFIVCYQIPN